MPDTQPTTTRILLVEDSPTQALRLRLLLEDEGFEVEEAGSAEAVLPLLNRALPHLLIVDHHLPGLQGGDLCRLIRLHVATLAMPILMLTADDSPARQREGLDSGADDFLAKSTDPAVLSLRVRQLLRHAGTEPGREMLPQTPFRQPRALVIGLEAPHITDLSALLVAEGCRIDHAADGASALHLVDHENFDLALVGETLPDMAGLALARVIRDRLPVAPALILVQRLTGDDRAMREILGAGVSDLYMQGGPTAPLQARLRALLRRRFLEEQNRRLLADFREREGRALRLEAERNAARTRAQLADQLAVANRRLADQALITSTITRHVRAGLVLTDASGVATYANPPAMALLGSDMPGASLFDRLGLPPLPTTGVGDHAAILTTPDRRSVPVIVAVTPLDGDNGPAGAVVQIIDVTERRQAEERQALLMAELSHRVKNTLATVLSIGAQTRRRHTDIDGFWQSFEGRLRALSETHNLLADHFWEWVRLDQLVRHEVKPYAQEPHDVVIDGPALELRPRTALGLALVFHELATNAAKYGSFSRGGGRLAVWWEIVPDGDGHILLTWKETGGPPLSGPPAHSGFGSILIRQSIGYELRGSSSLAFEKDGLRCALSFPLGTDIRRRIGPTVAADTGGGSTSPLSEGATER